MAAAKRKSVEIEEKKVAPKKATKKPTVKKTPSAPKVTKTVVTKVDPRTSNEGYKSLRCRIRAAKSEKAIAALLAEGKTYEYARAKTIRRWKDTANRRLRDLNRNQESVALAA